MSEGPVDRSPLGRRFLGVPWLWAVAHSGIAFSVYYSLGVVADKGLGMTPFIFAIAGLVYVVTTMTYVEGGAMFVERGGSNTLARHAFNELVSFMAGWAILIDYVIVIALAAITIPHYLVPISADLGTGTTEVLIAAGVVALAAVVNIVGFTGNRRQGLLVALTSADLLLQFAPDRRRARRRLGPVGAHRRHRPVHLAVAQRHGLRADHLDGRAGRDRGGIRPRARPRLGPEGPAERAAGRRRRRSRSSTSGCRWSR